MCGDLSGNSFAKVPSERAENRGCARDLSGDIVCEECSNHGGGQAEGKRVEKVAEIEFFEVRNRVENGHLSPDKVTKILDKVFALKKTLTGF